MSRVRWTHWTMIGGLAAFSFLATLATFADGAPAAVTQAQDPWPREFTTAKGNTVVVYQPQLETFKGNAVTGRAAVAVTRKGETAPVFGVVFFSATVAVDREANLVSVLSVKVERVRFPNRTEEQEKRFAALLEGEVPKWQLATSYDRFLENLKVAERERRSAEGLKHDPPKILFASEPTVLVTIDGEPQLRDVEGAHFKVVVNTPFLIV